MTAENWKKNWTFIQLCPSSTKAEIVAAHCAQSLALQRHLERLGHGIIEPNSWKTNKRKKGVDPQKQDFSISAACGVLYGELHNTLLFQPFVLTHASTLKINQW